jgi:hypothetical protein
MSGWIRARSGAAYAAPSILLRQGRLGEGREAVKKMPGNARYHRDLLEACLGLKPQSELEKIAQQDLTTQPAEPDREIWYYLRSNFGILRQERSRASRAEGGGGPELLRLLHPPVRPLAGGSGIERHGNNWRIRQALVMAEVVRKLYDQKLQRRPVKSIVKSEVAG